MPTATVPRNVLMDRALLPVSPPAPLALRQTALHIREFKRVEPDRRCARGLGHGIDRLFWLAVRDVGRSFALAILSPRKRASITELLREYRR